MDPYIRQHHRSPTLLLLISTITQDGVSELFIHRGFLVTLCLKSEYLGLRATHQMLTLTKIIWPSSTKTLVAYPIRYANMCHSIWEIYLSVRASWELKICNQQATKHGPCMHRLCVSPILASKHCID